MNTIKLTARNKIAYLQLDRGKSNAINAEMVAELKETIQIVENDSNIGGLIITGKEGFFSAGLDLIELYNYNEAQIKHFWEDFLELVGLLTAFKKPLISAITGHSPAGGCVLAVCSDYRVMADGKFIIGLNEVPIGIIVPEGIVHLYSFWLGNAKASQYLLEGKLMDPAEALSVGLIDEIVNPASIITAAERKMEKYIQLDWTTWQQSKLNIRKELIAKVTANHSQSLEGMLKQWWASSTRSILHTIIQNLQKK